MYIFVYVSATSGLVFYIVDTMCACCGATIRRGLESSLHVANDLLPNLVGAVTVSAKVFLGETHTCQSMLRQEI